MRAAIQDSKDATKLLAYSEDFEEDTARHEVTVNLHNPTPPQPSQPQIEVTEQSPGVWTVAITAVRRLSGWKLVAAIGITALAVLRWFGKL